MNSIKYFKLVLVAIPFILFSCSKGGDSGTTTTNPPPTPTPTEATVVFKVEVEGKAITDSASSFILPAIAATQAINVNVTSTLPKDGVTIDVAAKKNLDASVVSTSSIASTVGATNAVNISNLSSGVLCTVTVTVTSKTTTTNTSTKTFQIAKK